MIPTHTQNLSIPHGSFSCGLPAPNAHPIRQYESHESVRAHQLRWAMYKINVPKSLTSPDRIEKYIEQASKKRILTHHVLDWKPDRMFSHVVLDGQITPGYSIPLQKDRDTMYEELSRKVLLGGVPHSICERIPTGQFSLFFDLDVKTNKRFNKDLLTMAIERHVIPVIQLARPDINKRNFYDEYDSDEVLETVS